MLCPEDFRDHIDNFGTEFCEEHLEKGTKLAEALSEVKKILGKLLQSHQIVLDDNEKLRV